MPWPEHASWRQRLSLLRTVPPPPLPKSSFGTSFLVLGFRPALTLTEEHISPAVFLSSSRRAGDQSLVPYPVSPSV
ncbi:hypothetical protein G0U57_018161 [Chelydra serpentina]|uniref:Uncharacterized protein n=1 Tax=Chelydra serpentina TaxID=8475 RepID=A0A8T1S6J5_CHESE|nr:hypothetical protein G0U57_018161 [Chelydra serpentina]